MLFTSTTFFYFHLLVLVLRWILPRVFVGPLLLLSSYLFYLSWGPKYGFLIGGMTLGAWGVGIALEEGREARGKKLLLTGSIVVLLAVLAYFKYANFFSAQLNTLLRSVGSTHSLGRVDVILPLGISFFTFEMLSYVIDVYRGDKAERSLWRFALYIAYYPHLIAGPIVRAGELLPALRNPQRFDGRLFSDGMFIMLAGFFKKMVLADNMAPWADEVFAHPDRYSTLGTWVGVLAYTGQIYGDFSGYTDIARGASMTLGFPLPDNFDYPYLSGSITEFWRRWHMTLSRWLRDYLYISLGGNRHGKFSQYRNLFLTMLLGGLWHGANWTFVVWGALHGFFLAMHKLWDTMLEPFSAAKRVRASLPYRVVATLFTLWLVIFAWVFFRASTFTEAYHVLQGMSSARTGLGTPNEQGELPRAMQTALIAMAGMVVLHGFGSTRVGLRTNRAIPPSARGVLWLVLLLACFFLAESRAAFIYFQF